MVREAAPSDAAFWYFKVHAEFFEAHLDDFAMIGDDKINLFPSARPTNLFEDQRGTGRVSFARWSCSCGCSRVTGEWVSNTSRPRSIRHRGGVRSPRRARLP